MSEYENGKQTGDFRTHVGRGCLPRNRDKSPSFELPITLRAFTVDVVLLSNKLKLNISVRFFSYVMISA